MNRNAEVISEKDAWQIELETVSELLLLCGR